jgi:hypothetical protein
VADPKPPRYRPLPRSTPTRSSRLPTGSTNGRSWGSVLGLIRCPSPARHWGVDGTWRLRRPRGLVVSGDITRKHPGDLAGYWQGGLPGIQQRAGRRAQVRASLAHPTVRKCRVAQNGRYETDHWSEQSDWQRTARRPLGRCRRCGMSKTLVSWMLCRVSSANAESGARVELHLN